MSTAAARKRTPRRSSGPTATQWRAATAKFSKWIHQRARKFARNLPVHVAANAYEDLVAVGFRGFVEAMQKLDPQRKDSEEAYVRRVVTGAMLDELRRMDPLTRDQRRRQRVLRDAERELTRKLGRPPSEDEMACATRNSLEEFQSLAADTNPILVSIDAPPRVDAGEALVGQLPNPASSDPFEATLLGERRAMVSRAMERLPRPHRTVLTKYYIEGNTLQSISTGMNVCAARVSQIRSEGVSRLQRELGL